MGKCLHKNNRLKNIIEIQEFQQFDNLELIARQVVEGFITGMHKSPFHGFSVEFAEHRLYNTGESTKHIDWKLFARTDKLFVKKYEEETNLRAHILLDISGSMLYPVSQKNRNSKLAFSIFSAAALIYMLRKQRDAAGITQIADGIEWHSEAKVSASHSKYLFETLNQLLSQTERRQTKASDSDKKTNLTKSIHLLAEKIHKRSLVILFTDMFESDNTDELFSALQHLRYNKHEVILFHVHDSNSERKFDFPNRPHRFVDLETGEVVKLNPANIREEFEKRATEFHNNIKLKCGQYQIDFVEADCSKDFSQVLLPFLIKRGKLH